VAWLCGLAQKQGNTAKPALRNAANTIFQQNSITIALIAPKDTVTHNAPQLHAMIPAKAAPENTMANAKTEHASTARNNAFSAARIP
jgi:hypothetical protein